MTWFIFSLSSIFALALAELTQQYLLNLKDGFSPRTSGVITFAIQSIAVLPLIFIFGFGNEFLSIMNKEVFIKMTIGSLLASIAMIFYLKSFQVKNISLSTIFLSCSVIVSTTLGIIFFGESTSLFKFAGITFVLFAITVLNLNNPVLEKKHLLGILAGALFGIVYTIDKSIVVEIEPIIYLFWALFTTSIIAFLLGPKEVISQVRIQKISAYKPLLISSFGYILYNFFTFSAYKIGGEVGRVDAINNSQIFIIILFEYFVLKHTEGTKRKLLSATLAFTGVLILGLT